MSWPRVPILPDPEEDIRIAGVPVGRLAWLGPLLAFPAILAILAVSTGTLVMLPMAGAICAAIYALLGLDLWKPIAWAALYALRPQRRGAVARLGDAGSQADASLLARLAAPAARVGSWQAALTDPTPVDYSDPDAAWRRWAEAVRRATGRGMTVRVAVWVDPDWDPEAWERERLALEGIPDGRLRDLALARWALHGELALERELARRTPHQILVMPGLHAGEDDLASVLAHAGQALAGAGTWRTLGPEDVQKTLRRWADCRGWLAAPDCGVRADAAPPAGEDHGVAEGAPAQPPGAPAAGWAGAHGGPEDGLGEEDRDVPADGHAQPRRVPAGAAADAPELPASEPDTRPAATGTAGADPAAQDTQVQGNAPPVSAPRETERKIPVVPWDLVPDPVGTSDADGLGALTARAAGAIHGIFARARKRVWEKDLWEKDGRDDATDGPDILDGPSRPLIAVWSPTSAGATTVSAELAAALARGGVPVALLDLDTHTRALGARLCLPPGANALSAALSARPTDPAPDGLPIWPGVWVYADAPEAPPTPDIGLWRLGRLLAAGAPDAEWWVADLQRDGPLVVPVLEAAWAIVLVADPDWSRVGLVRRAFQEWATQKPVLPVVNRWAAAMPGVPGARPAEVWGAEPAAVFPLDPAAYTATVTGQPAATHSGAIASAADALALAVGRAVIQITGKVPGMAAWG
ncbi:MAG: hypothetical protein RB148_11355 [Armatimonadota bacterium]|nr:hypothetical protein [Armatimonadota bacterium]